MSGDNIIKLLLISDLHCVGTVWPAFNRITGDTRATEKALELFDSVVTKYIEVADYVLVVGDLTDSGKENQYKAVSEALGNYDAEKFCVIPGNHDLANFNILRSWKTKMKMFKKYFGGYMHPQPEPLTSQDFFPYIRELNEHFVLIAMESTVAATAHGRLGDDQLGRLEEFLTDNKYSGRHKIVMLHHDPIGKIKHYSGFDIPYGNVMEDAEEFVALVTEHAGKNGGATVIFGHTHNSAHSIEKIDSVNFVRVPSMGSIYGEDFLYIELSTDGDVVCSESELESGGGIKIRKLKDIWKTLLPDKFT